MRRSTIQLLAFAALLAAAATLPASAQAPDGAADVPDGWRQAAVNLNAISVAMISYARAHGETPADAGRHVGQLLSSAWRVPEGADPAQFFANGMAANYGSWPGASPVVAREDGGLTIRFNRTYRGWFGPQERAFGVTLEGYEAFTTAVAAAVAEELGLDVELTTTRETGTLHVRNVGG